MKMTDEQFIEWLRKISNHCASQPNCNGCKFCIDENDAGTYCQIWRLAGYLSNAPIYWNMEEIERIIRL